MAEKILDLHIHSKYSRACSKKLELPEIAKTCAVRGIDIVATGDFTHPKWFEHIKENLVEFNPGVYRLRSTISHQPRREVRGPISQASGPSAISFVIGTEISSIKKHAGKTRRVHHLIFAPSIDVAQMFNKKLSDRGINLNADGRPIIGMTSKDILELMLETDERMVMIPAHAWTPWFGIFGSKGGYDSMGQCFEDLTQHVFAIETGLSSDPFMNWRWSALDDIALISNSDAHSPQKLGREANVMDFGSDKEITYDEIMRILRDRDKDKFLYTIEFYPEEGKYHVDGHRECGFSCTPEETKRLKGICPKCKKDLVVGVLNRVEELSDRSIGEALRHGERRVGYKSMVPLVEIISDTLQKGVGTKTVLAEYDNLTNKLGSEFSILLHKTIEEIEMAGSKQIADAIDRVRCGDIFIKPGYDGEFGAVKVFGEGDSRGKTQQVSFDFE